MDWSIVGIVVTLGLAIVVWVRRKYFTQPELTMELKSDGGHSLPRGMSNHQGVPDEIAGTANNPVHIYDADEVNGVHFLAMEYVRGVDLARYVRERGALPVPVAPMSPIPRRPLQFV